MTKDALAVDYAHVAVLVPCYNEENTVAKVVADFKAALPGASVYVFDNCSSDNTGSCALQAGATVCQVRRRGKGNVVRRMFADVEAQVYVLVDGDDTYDAASAPRMVAELEVEGLDMVVGTRLTHFDAGAFRHGHRFGNDLLTGVLGMIFGRSFSDILSGYRVFSRRFVKSFPALAQGFETESELTVHALELRMPIAEVPTPYKDRPPGSASRLNTIRDGIRILRTIMRLVKEERPLPFFSALSGLLAIVSLLFSIPIFTNYFATGLVPRLPTAVLATGLMLLAFLSLACGLILDTVTHGRRELKRLRYLAIPAPVPTTETTPE